MSFLEIIIKLLMVKTLLIKSLADNGTKEIILLGQNVSSYKDDKVIRRNLAKLIKKNC